MRCWFAEQRTEIHSHTERNRIQLKMYAAAVSQPEKERGNRIYIQRCGETIVAHQTCAAGRLGRILEHAVVPYDSAGTTRGSGYKPAENFLLAPRSHVVGQSAYAHRVAEIIRCSRFEVRDFAEGDERAVKEVRIVEGVAHA